MISVIIPAHNEAEFLWPAVQEVVSGVRAVGRPCEVVIVENGSADATAAVAKELSGDLEEVRTISLPRADYGSALRTGILSAAGDVVVLFNVDYYDLEFLEQAVSLVEDQNGPAVALASKRAPDAADLRPLHRRFITAALAGVLRGAFGLRASDTHGIKAVRRAAVAAIVEECGADGDLFDTELILRAERTGLTVVELPISVEERRPPRTSILTRGLRAVPGLVRLRLRLWREERGRLR